MTQTSMLDAALRRDRAVVVVALAAVTAVCWAWLLRDAWLMYYANSDLPPCCQLGAALAVPGMRPWGVVDLLALFAMWAVMMVAMMVPCAAPMVLTYAAVHRRRRQQQRPYTPTSLFLLGYLLIWLGYSLAATMAQALLHHFALLSPMMVSTRPQLGGLLLVITGLSQWSNLKHACLTHCRSPLEFIMTRWREGGGGAVRMGIHHGVYCTVCCWLLMALMFVLGVMNMAWMAVLTILMLAEKVVPRGHAVANFSGVLFLFWGVALFWFGR